MDNFQVKAALAIRELEEVFQSMDDHCVRPLLEAAKSHKRIFTVGAGREGLSTKAFAMRLTHMGKESHWIWDDTTPFIGEGDLLIAACGSGKIDNICMIIQKAKQSGAAVAVVTASDSGSAVDMADIVVKLPAAAYKAEGSFVSTKQPMGNLFEQALYVFYDIIVMMACEEMGVSQEEMERRHRNVE